MTQSTDQRDAQQSQISPAASVFAGAGIGLMVGTLLGLAMSPAVAGFVGAIGTALAVFLGLNDRHFSLAKALRIGAFGVCTVIAAGIGLYAKLHTVLSPSLIELKNDYMAAGFSECQALGLLADQSPRRYAPKNDSNLEERKAAYIKLGFNECEALSLLEGRPAAAGPEERQTTNMSAVQRRGAGAGLMAQPIKTTACSTLNLIPYPSSRSFQTLRGAFADTGSEWKKWSTSVANSSLSADEKQELLFVGRTAVCSLDQEHKVSACDKLRRIAAESSAPLQRAFGEVEELTPLRDRVNGKISSTSDAELALGLIQEALCGIPE